MPRIGRTLPPALAPITARQLLGGMFGCCRGEQERERFESEVRAFFKARHSFAVSSGKTALLLLLRALAQLYPGRNEVLIPAYTCYSVPAAITRAGLNIRLCDLDPTVLDFDFEKLEQFLSRPGAAERLLCIIPTHFFGMPADLSRLRNALGEKSLGSIMILEDAAQAMGERNREGRLGTLGDAGFFSLGRGKPLSLGEGGIIVTSRDDLAAILRPMVAALPSYSPAELIQLILLVCSLVCLVRPRLFWLPKALPWLRLGETIFDPSFRSRRMSPFQAGLARGWPARLLQYQDERLAKVRYWETILASGNRGYSIGDQEEGVTRKGQASSGGRGRPGRPVASHPSPRASGRAGDLEDSVHGDRLGCFNTDQAALIRYPVRVRSRYLREKILACSERAGLGIMTTFPAAINGIPALSGKLGDIEEFPRAAALAEELLTLPVHRFVSPVDQERIAALIRSADHGKATDGENG